MTNEFYLTFSYNNFPIVSKQASEFPKLKLPNTVEYIIDHRIGHGAINDLCVKLKAHELIKHVPILLISTNADLKVITEDSCADDYISKPFDIDDVEKVVEELIMSY